jgi:hypothetical protein
LGCLGSYKITVIKIDCSIWNSVRRFVNRFGLLVWGQKKNTPGEMTKIMSKALCSLMRP